MKYLLHFITLLYITTVSLSGQECTGGAAMDSLSVNNIKADLLNSGDMFWDLNDKGFEYPAGSDNHLLFSAGLWMGGIDELGQLVVAAQTYRQTGSDFFPGPITNTSETCQDFDRHWSVDGEDILFFLTEYYAGNISDGSQIDPSILAWPATGNPYFDIFNEFTLPADKNLAPFWDENGDEIYNPLEGDYPVIDSSIEGVFADRMVWGIFNDAAEEKGSGGLPLGMEVGALFYAWSGDIYLDNTIFVKYDFNLVEGFDIDEFYIAQYADLYMGQSYNTNLVGCLPEQKMAFFYTQDSSITGYGTEIPVLGLKAMEDLYGNTGADVLFSSLTVLNNDFTSVQGNPELPDHYLNYMTGKWKDGTPITYGGNGIDGDSITSFIYTGNPNDADSWAHCNQETFSYDKRAVMSIGPFEMEVGETRSATFAYIVSPGNQQTHPCPSTEGLESQCVLAETNYQEQKTPFLGNPPTYFSLQKTNLSKTNVYPNPAQEYIILQMEELTDFNKKEIQIIDCTGRIIKIIETDPAIDDRRVVVGDFPDGVYFYKISNNKGSTIGSGKFIKHY